MFKTIQDHSPNIKVSHILFLAFSSASALAHPGHALGDYGATHLFGSLDHAAMLAALAALLWLGARLFERRMPRRILGLAGAMAITSAAIVWFTGA